MSVAHFWMRPVLEKYPGVGVLEWYLFRQKSKEKYLVAADADAGENAVPMADGALANLHC